MDNNPNLNALPQGLHRKMTEEFLKERTAERPALPGLPSPSEARSQSVADVLQEHEQANAYLNNVPAEAWITFQAFCETVPFLMKSENQSIIIHVDTDDWKVLVHERHVSHPVPTHLRSNPPVAPEYLSLPAIVERLTEWRKRGFRSNYLPSNMRLLAMGGNENSPVFNIGFSNIRIHRTPKGFVWCDRYNTAVPLTLLRQTVFFPTMKERSLGSVRKPTKQQILNNLGTRYKANDINLLDMDFEEMSVPEGEKIDLYKFTKDFLVEAGLSAEVAEAEALLIKDRITDSRIPEAERFDTAEALVGEILSRYDIQIDENGIISTGEISPEELAEASRNLRAQDEIGYEDQAADYLKHANDEVSDEEISARAGERDPLQGFPNQEALDKHEAWKDEHTVEGSPIEAYLNTISSRNQLPSPERMEELTNMHDYPVEGFTAPVKLYEAPNRRQKQYVLASVIAGVGEVLSEHANRILAEKAMVKSKAHGLEVMTRKQFDKKYKAE
jgi:hypothetical protein